MHTVLQISPLGRVYTHYALGTMSVRRNVVHRYASTTAGWFKDVPILWKGGSSTRKRSSRKPSRLISLNHTDALHVEFRAWVNAFQQSSLICKWLASSRPPRSSSPFMPHIRFHFQYSNKRRHTNRAWTNHETVLHHVKNVESWRNLPQVEALIGRWTMDDHSTWNHVLRDWSAGFGKWRSGWWGTIKEEENVDHGMN